MAAGLLTLALMTFQPAYAEEYIGVASWYGAKFQGKVTASGERFDMHQLTLASREIPLKSEVLITNLHNGRTCRAKVTDRGPWIKGRRFDVSRRVARELKMEKRGLAKVKVKVLKHARRKK